ncbi:hypothetical protein AL755_03005 (plasmid) [Arthrobacter sp. ERGS1:01]|uniref:MAB_1171c family putative transporter n=1 Tax=Arthrobacter sp. ERGS1:01 TaxID=1704044 RepID=UPI0006B3F9B9|nr:MAB_1171c family putative transporter [Arthrobacter sp. ERGS1:01]ALE04615.1 hypothetical protein AL755_03005 [Arthrobacter sp. ERGS1:01]
MLLVPALTLWAMAIVRLTAIVDPRRSHLFRATVFAAAACTLHLAPVYYAVDPVLGGHNTVGLVLLLFLLTGFWQFRAAIMLAALTDNVRRRHQLAIGNSAMTVAGIAVTVGFLTSRVDRTDQNLPVTYGDQFGMQVFLWTGSLFILWACLDITFILHRHTASLHAVTFRLGFWLIGLGIAAFCLTLVDRLLSGMVMAAHDSGNDPLSFLNSLNGVAETSAVVLVGIGIVLPRLGRPVKHLLRDLQARLLLIEIHTTWRQVTTGTSDVVLNPNEISLLDFLAVKPVRRLHRRVIEVRDCEFKRPERPLRPKSLALVSHIEDTLIGR